MVIVNTYAIVSTFCGTTSPIIPIPSGESSNTQGDSSTRLVFAFIHTIASAGVAKVLISKVAPIFTTLATNSSIGSPFDSRTANLRRFFTHGITSEVNLSSGIMRSSIFVTPAFT